MPTRASLGAPSGAHGGLSGCSKWCPRGPLWVLQVMPTGAPLGAPGGAHGCPAGCLEPYPPTPLRVPLWVPQAMPRGARSTGAALGTACPAGRPAPCPGAAGCRAGLGGHPTPGQRAAKGQKPPQKGAEAAAGRTAPLTQTKNPAAVPPRRRLPRPPFRGVPAPPGRGRPLPAVIFYSFAGFSLSLCRSRYTPRAHQGRGPGPGPPRPPRPPAPHGPPDPRSPPWCFTIFDYTIVRSHYR
ncbi:atherin-like isoform X3 [Ammospiza nelsoni]|uniref:atherin-like isoform X3 n=1 Tax=Ammospiza nelsoni TaxID=2857394 RepID=UPI00286CCD6E|nr:atherin-like isoform X3 [Ammospiza nelsoni]